MTINILAEDLIKYKFNWRDIYYFYKKNWIKLDEIRNYIDFLLKNTNERDLLEFLWEEDNEFEVENFLKKKSLLSNLSSINIINYILLYFQKQDNYKYFLEIIEEVWGDFLHHPLLDGLIYYMPIRKNLINEDDSYLNEGTYRSKIAGTLKYIQEHS